jgi:hypothetical protein
VEDAAQAFKEFEKALRGAIDAGSATHACRWLINELGPRFPYRPDRIKAVSVTETIMSAPAVSGPSELVGRTKAG